MNVDIRVVVDVTEGNVDVFFSPESQMFVVGTNKVRSFQPLRSHTNAFSLYLNGLFSMYITRINFLF